MLKYFLVVGVFSLVLLPLARAEEPKPSLEIIGKTHTIATSNAISGAGSKVPNLAATYDMSLFEFNLGGKQSTFNGSGITTNSNYPLTDGEAISNNTHLGLSSKFSEDLKAGFLAEFYTLQGDETVGRTFGEELPWDNFPRNNSGTIHPARFQADFYNAFLEGKHEDFQYKFVGGTLSPRELPEFTRKEMNQVKLGSLVYRAPITNASFFEKEDRKLEEGRHPLRGFDFVGNYEYTEHKNIHVELFSGASKPTPVSDIDRDSVGGHFAVDAGEGNIGLTYVYNNGLRQNTSTQENQEIWSIDSSYKILAWLVPYFTFAQTDYERENTNESHWGSAYVGGILIKLPEQYELKVQYQRLDENYDLMAIHKSEHYPGNSQGGNFQLTAPLTETVKLKGIVGFYQQLETATTSSDTLFGDSFFPSNAGADEGKIQVQRVSAEWKAVEKLTLNSYVEHVRFNQEATPIAASIDKDVYNFYVGGALALTKEWTVEAGMRRFLSKGNWQAMSFDSYQDIPEAALSYKVNKETRATLIYHYYNFQDENTASQGQNDYDGHQIIAEVRIPL